MNDTTRGLVLASFLVAIVRPGWAADHPTPPLPAQVEELDSQRLGERREVWISLPDGYSATARRYPVVYMMDGELNFTSGVIGGLRYAAQVGEIPELIVVGIRNTRRELDAFPWEITFADGEKAGGRADRYLAFLREELVPWVEARYRTARFRIVYGTSNTGLTAIYALFHDPDLADLFVAASATLAVEPFQAELPGRLRSYAGGPRELVLVAGERDLPTVVRLNAALAEAIDSTAPPGLSCRL